MGRNGGKSHGTLPDRSNSCQITWCSVSSSYGLFGHSSDGDRVDRPCERLLPIFGPMLKPYRSDCRCD
eukprot:scaffold13509_cov157-Amphora_coffeaeformis.AAC.1